MKNNRKRWLLIAAVALILCAFIPVKSGTVTVLWDFNFDAFSPPCTPADAVGCVKEFRVHEGTRLLATIPVDPASTGMVGGITSGPLTLRVGKRTITVAAYTDSGIPSDPRSASVDVKPEAVINIRVP